MRNFSMSHKQTWRRLHHMNSRPSCVYWDHKYCSYILVVGLENRMVHMFIDCSKKSLLKVFLRNQNVLLSRYKLIRRRVIWLIGQWISVKFKSDLRPLLYEVILSLMQDPDLVVRQLNTQTQNGCMMTELVGQLWRPLWCHISLNNLKHSQYYITSRFCHLNTQLSIIFFSSSS